MTSFYHVTYTVFLVVVSSMVLHTLKNYKYIIYNSLYYKCNFDLSRLVLNKKKKYY